MNTLDSAAQTQLNNIVEKTGKSLNALQTMALSSGLSKHSELRTYFKQELSLGYGDANALAHFVRQPEKVEEKDLESVLDDLYSGKKEVLHPIHEAIWSEVVKFGPFETVPKQKYLSLRRKKQFAMIGPATNTRVEVGLNVKELPNDPRLIEQPKGRMCNFIVKLTDPSQVDDQLFEWLKAAYKGAS